LAKTNKLVSSDSVTDRKLSGTEVIFKVYLLQIVGNAYGECARSLLKYKLDKFSLSATCLLPFNDK